MRLNLIRTRSISTLLTISVFILISCTQQKNSELSIGSNYAGINQKKNDSIVPMNSDELAKWEHLTTGTNVYPYLWLKALNSVNFKDENGTPSLPVLSPSFEEMTQRYGLVQSNHMKFTENGQEKQFILPYTGLTVEWTNHSPQNSNAFANEEELVRNINGMKSIKTIGTNCSLCHQAELNLSINNKNEKVHVLGAPSAVTLKNFYGDIVVSTVALFVKQDMLESFLGRIKDQNPELSFIDPKRDSENFSRQFKNDVAEHTLTPILNSLDQKLKQNHISFVGDLSYLWTLVSAKYLNDKTQFRKIRKPLTNGFLRLARLTHGLTESDNIGELEILAEWFGARAIGERPDLKSTPFLFGRSDAFGAFGNNYVRGDDLVNENAPVSFPWVWGTKYMSMKHYFANMNSTLLRNVGQTLAVGGAYSVEKNMTSVNLHALYYLENLMYQIAPPSWEKVFADQKQITEYQIQKNLLESGKKIYESKCQSCHETDSFVGPHKNLRDYKVFSLTEIGTDPNTAINVTKTVNGTNFSVAASKVVNEVRKIYYSHNPMSEKEKLEISAVDLHGKEFVRDTYLGFQDQNKYDLDYGNTPAGSGYKARHLSGAWATGPFLHNGSVPTLYDLLQPVNKRPKAFILKGTQEFDIEKIGIKTSVFEECPKSTSIYEKCLDTRIAGNSNMGHEYGVELSEQEKKELIEYLKVLPAEPEYR
tara:strand:+ start:79047 stop:81158 length:2112 start_codon:yes stop_codon:yes gene_type:complete